MDKVKDPKKKSHFSKGIYILSDPYLIWFLYEDIFNL